MLNRPFKTNTLFVTASAGIGVEAPNQALTVVGNVSATGIFYGDGSGLTNLPGGGGDSTIFSKLSSQAYTLVDATSSIIPIRGDNTATGNYSVVAGGGSKTVTVGTNISNDILAYWKLDNDGSGSVSLVDSTGNSNTLTNSGGVTLGTGIIAGDSVFDGANRLYSDTFGVNVNADFSVGFWIKATIPFNSYQHIFGAPFQNGLYIGGGITEGSLRIELFDGSFFYGAVTQVLDINEWYYVTLTRSGNNLYSYLNGVELSNIDISGVSFSASQVISIGGGEFNEYFFTGQIDEVGIWSRALSPSEITALYNSGTGNSYPFGGTSNIILPANVASGNYSFIAGGYSNDTNSKENTFILGSNITALSANYTYVNNLSSQGSIHGTFYGDGSGLTNLPGSTSTATISSYIFTGDGVTTLFDLNTTTEATNAAGYLVTLNGATQIPYTDYSLVYSTGTNKLSTSFVPRTGSTLSIISLIGGSTTNSGTVNKAVTSIGNGADTTFDFHHNLNTVDVITQVYNNVNGSVVIPTITNINIAAVRVEFSAPPSQDQYRVVVVG